MIAIAIAYLSIGVCISVGGFFIQHRPKSNFAKEVDTIFHPNRSLMYVVKEALVVPIALMGIVLCWPIFIYMVFEGVLIRRPKKNCGIREKVFATQGKYLKSKLSVEDVEANSYYADPLDAVPHVPFGHLNQGWNQFIENLEDGDELWSFLIPKGALIGEHNFAAAENMSGYSILRNNKTIAEFIYEASGGY